jgi:hypothetical protein
MSVRVEKLLKEYPMLIRERNCLAHQIAHFRGVTAEDVIQSMYTPRMDGERVQTSGTSDKTAQIALSYQERMDRINREWFDHLENKLRILNEELQFLESALGSLSKKLPDIMRDMVIGQMPWDSLSDKYFVSRRMIGKYRKKAIEELDVLYERRDKETAAYILS